MINRVLDIIFVDSFAFGINATFGILLRTKICNYSWEGEIGKQFSTEEIDPKSTQSLDYVDTTTSTL